jgi:hypothetical protein
MAVQKQFQEKALTHLFYTAGSDAGLAKDPERKTGE